MLGNVTGSDIEQACELLYDQYQETLRLRGLSPATQAFTRIHLADIANHSDAVRNSRLYSLLSHGAVSMIGQAPVYDDPISIHSYHLVPRDEPPQRCLLNHHSPSRNSGLLIDSANYRLLWLANYDGHRPFDWYAQTEESFHAVETQLSSLDMNLRHNTMRTWVYVRDIDNHYQDMVRARRDLFHRIGLTDKTRYITSTGIEGKAQQEGTLISMDALSIGGLNEEQLVRMEAPENMPPTVHYGVTFERGLRIRFGDRSHLYVAGTASIGRDGKVLYVGDAKKQTERTLDNMSALLAPQNAQLSDMMYLYVYVRDPALCDTVRSVVEQRVPADVPVLYLQGAVCRPDWLVEIEGEGRIADRADFPIFR